MTRDEQDKKEYEEFKAQHQERYRLIADWALNEFWLASRRLMREKLGKWHDVDEFYKENKDG